jgi:hypothetical protein
VSGLDVPAADGDAVAPAVGWSVEFIGGGVSPPPPAEDGRRVGDGDDVVD